MLEAGAEAQMEELLQEQGGLVVEAEVEMVVPYLLE